MYMDSYPWVPREVLYGSRHFSPNFMLVPLPSPLPSSASTLAYVQKWLQITVPVICNYEITRFVCQMRSHCTALTCVHRVNAQLHRRRKSWSSTCNAQLNQTITICTCDTREHIHDAHLLRPHYGEVVFLFELFFSKGRSLGKLFFLGKGGFWT